jgi:hypothetical protein
VHLSYFCELCLVNLKDALTAGASSVRFVGCEGSPLPDFE